MLNTCVVRLEPQRDGDNPDRTAESVLGAILIEERLHVSVLVGLDHWFRQRVPVDLLLPGIRQSPLRALEHGAGRLVLLNGVVGVTAGCTARGPRANPRRFDPWPPKARLPNV